MKPYSEEGQVVAFGGFRGFISTHSSICNGSDVDQILLLRMSAVTTGIVAYS